MSRQTWFHLLLLYGLLAGLAFVTTGGSEARAPRRMAIPATITNSIGMELAEIPSGKFKIGSPESDSAYRFDDEEQRELTIKKTFWMGVHEVTQGQFKEVLGYNPSFFSKNGTGKRDVVYSFFCQPAGGEDKVPADTSNFPVENVTYAEAIEFCKKLTARTGERGRIYRLPRDAEWEYACRSRAAAYQVFHFGNTLSSRQANFDPREPLYPGAKAPFLQRTCKVGSYAKNRFGLYDMHGNVREWCSGYDGYTSKIQPGASKEEIDSLPPTDPVKIVRGGSWRDKDFECRSAYRGSSVRIGRANDLGFRVVFVPSRKELSNAPRK